MFLHADYWKDSYRFVTKYIKKWKIKFPCEIHLFPDDGVDGLIINPFKHITNSADKKIMNEIFKELDIPHPKTYDKQNGWVQALKLAVCGKRFIRKSRYGMEGNGKKIYPKFPKLNPEKYFIQEYWDHDVHLRLYWLLGYRLVWCVLKDGHGEIRNWKYDWKYYPLNKNKIPEGFPLKQFEIYNHCKRLETKTKLNFFAIDIAWRSDTQEYMFLEMNSMPAIRRMFRIKPFIRRLVQHAKRESKSSI